MEEKKENFLKRVSKRFGNLLVLVITMLVLFVFFSIRSPYFFITRV